MIAFNRDYNDGIATKIDNTILRLRIDSEQLLPHYVCRARIVSSDLGVGCLGTEDVLS